MSDCHSVCDFGPGVVRLCEVWMLCVTGPQIWFRRHPRPNLAQGSWVQRARPQVTRARSSIYATKGWVKEHKGQYYDALHVKNGIVKICLVESQGGIAPPKSKRIIFFNFAKEVGLGSPSAVDRNYGTASGSARGFAQHHSQQLSRAAVCGDAQNINNAARNMRVAHSFMTGLNAPPPCARAF